MWKLPQTFATALFSLRSSLTYSDSILTETKGFNLKTFDSNWNVTSSNPIRMFQTQNHHFPQHKPPKMVYHKMPWNHHKPVTNHHKPSLYLLINHHKPPKRNCSRQPPPPKSSRPGRTWAFVQHALNREIGFHNRDVTVERLRINGTVSIMITVLIENK